MSEENEKEIYPGIGDDFDLNQDVKLKAWTANWFIKQGLKIETALKTLKLSMEDYEKWKNVEE